MISVKYLVQSVQIGGVGFSPVGPGSGQQSAASFVTLTVIPADGQGLPLMNSVIYFEAPSKQQLEALTEAALSTVPAEKEVTLTLTPTHAV